MQVLKLRDELELKVNVLSLPVDICVQQALQGNSALQGALNVALKVLQDIEDFEGNLQQQEIDLVSPLLAAHCTISSQVHDSICWYGYAQLGQPSICIATQAVV